MNEDHTVKHLRESIGKTFALESRMDESLKIRGLSSFGNTMLLNNLCNTTNVKYLEIGTYTGATLVAAIDNNDPDLVIGIDNFSEFISVSVDQFDSQIQKESLESFRKKYSVPSKELFFRNSKKFTDKLRRYKFIEKNCWDITKEDLENEKFNIYFYDGGHSEEDHYNALDKYIDYMEDVFIFIVDDYRWASVRLGTQKIITDLINKARIKILCAYELDHENLIPPDDHGYGFWWNGFYVAAIRRIY